MVEFLNRTIQIRHQPNQIDKGAALCIRVLKKRHPDIEDYRFSQVGTLQIEIEKIDRKSKAKRRTPNKK